MKYHFNDIVYVYNGEDVLPMILGADINMLDGYESIKDRLIKEGLSRIGAVLTPETIMDITVVTSPDGIEAYFYKNYKFLEIAPTLNYSLTFGPGIEVSYGHPKDHIPCAVLDK